MAFQSIAVYNASPVFQTLIDEYQVTDPVFSFKLSPSGAELYIGGANCELYTGSFAYTPVTEQVSREVSSAHGHILTLVNQGFWQVMMDNVQVDGQTILGNAEAIIDTGTTLVYGDPSQVSTLYDTLGAKTAPSSVGDGFYTCEFGPYCVFWLH